MATPKIKLYKLPTGYSSANDNDVQVATNDQLLPVKLKNVMPNQAYTLLGVSNKKNQVLIPVIHIDGGIDYSDANTIANWPKLTTGGLFPAEVAGIKLDKFLICDKSQMSPKFFKIVSDSTSGTQQYLYYKYGTDYQYVQDINEQLSSGSDIKFVYGRNKSKTDGKLYVKIVDTSISLDNLYVCNLFKYCLNECVATFYCVNKNTVYNLLKSDCNQDALFENDNLFTSDYLPNQFVPFYHSKMVQELKPKIMYNFGQEIQPRVLDQKHGNFNITKDYKLTNIIEDQDLVGVSGVVYNDVYGEEVILQYYTIPKNSKYVINGKYDGSTFKKITNNTLEQVDGEVGYIYHDCSVWQYNGTLLDNVGFYVSSDNGKQYYIGKSFTLTNDITVEQCYAKDGVCYSDSTYQTPITLTNNNYYIIKNSYYSYSYYRGKDVVGGFYKTSLSNVCQIESSKYIYKDNADQVIIDNRYYYTTPYQKLYNGIVDGNNEYVSNKPNTMFLQYLKTADFKNFNLTISDSQQLDSKIDNFEEKLIASRRKKYRNVNKQDINDNDSLLTTVGEPVSDKIQFGFSRGAIIGTTYRRNLTKSSSDIQWRICNKGTDLNDKALTGVKVQEYGLDTEKGLFDLTNILTDTDQDKDYKVCDYFYCDCYYQDSPTKLFISDYQCWVIQHMRNNPDIFYGKENYNGDDYIDANNNTIETGAIPRYVQDDYIVQYRDGSVTFGAQREDLNFQNGAQGGKIQTDPITGVVKGGVARANFAYYTKLQNVVQQKLDFVDDYAGGGYKYQAISDKKYPDSIGRRWITRDNIAQFMSFSMITKKLNKDNVLTDYNLPDLQTTQLQQLGRLGFQYCESKNENLQENERTYIIKSNEFSRLHLYKINNLSSKETPEGDVFYLKDQKDLSDEEFNAKYDSDKFKQASTLVARQWNSFQKNVVDFKTVGDDETDSKVIGSIDVEYCQTCGIPAIKVRVPILTNAINVFDCNEVKIEKQDGVIIGDEISFYYLNNNQLSSIGGVSVSTLSVGTQEVMVDNKTITKSYYVVPVKGNTTFSNIENFYVKFYKQFVMFRGQPTNGEQLVKQLVKQQVGQTQYYNYIVSSNYMFSKTNKNCLFVISNALQSTFFELKVVDFYNDKKNSYCQTVVYSIKKSQSVDE